MCNKDKSAAASHVRKQLEVAVERVRTNAGLSSIAKCLMRDLTGQT